jgi:hypothetical protein
MTNQVEGQEESVEAVASGDLDLKPELATMLVQDMPISDVLAPITNAKNIGEFFGWHKEGVLYKYTTINNMPVEVLDKPLEIINPDQRKAYAWAAIELAIGAMETVEPRLHIAKFDHNRAIVQGAKWVLDRTNVWRPYDYVRGVGFIQNLGYVSPAAQFKQTAINAIVSGQPTRITWEPDKQRLAVYMLTQLKVTLKQHLENRDRALEASREGRQSFNAAKSDTRNGVALPEHIFIEIDGKVKDLMTVANGTKFQLCKPNGEFIRNVTWRPARDNKVRMFLNSANGNEKLISGWKPNEPGDES